MRVSADCVPRFRSSYSIIRKASLERTPAAQSLLSRTPFQIYHIIVFILLVSSLLAAQSVTVTPASLPFGNQALSTTSAAKTVTLKNGTTSSITISAVSASGDFADPTSCGASLAAGASCTISVTFTPTATGSRTGTLTITDSASNSPQTVSLSGTGVLQATMSPASLSFGNQALATTGATKTVTLKNNLPTALSISSIAVTGDFAQTNTCGTSLGSGASCTINVAFTPTATGARTGTLTVTDSASNSPQTDSLSGVGIAQATTSPASLSFGSQAVGTSSTAKTVTLTNNLGTSLSISSVTVSGDYSQTNTCGTSLAANTNCTISITFSPTTTGSRTGTLTVTDGANNSPQTASLTGNGVVPVTVSPVSLAFGNQAVTTTSAAKSVTVSNKQPTAVTITSITTPTAYSETNTCGSLLAAQGTCTVSVTFSPATTGSQPGTLTITDNASNSPQTVNLTGTGTALPVITSLSTKSGTVGTSVTITGTGFGGSQGSSTVTFGGAVATPTNWKATSIVVPVPTAATTGNVTVTVNGGASNGVAFTVVPIITSVTVGTGIAGTSVTITGTGFGPSQGSSLVTFNGTSTVPTTWSATSVTAPVPAAAPGGTGSVVVTVSGTASNGVAFTVVPNITSLSTTSASIGSSVTISGTGFGTSQGGSMVAFNGTAASPTSWSSGAIVVAVPNGATTGNVVVSVGGAASSGVSFTVAPSITGLSASSGIAAAPVTITGTGFGSQQGTSVVTVNGTTASPTNWTATSITAPVPGTANGGTGTIVVTVGGIPSNGAPFSVVPNIASLSATSGAVGSAVTVAGTGFGSTQGGSTVTFNGASATATSWSNGSITALVPTGATSGNVVVTVGGVPSGGFAFSVLNGGFVATTGQMTSGVYGQTATQLTSGQVLITGGIGTSGVLSSAALYSPSNQSFVAASPLSVPRWLHTATLLNDGTVLIAGGSSVSSEATLNSAEIYSPTSGTFTLLPSTLNTARVGHTATLLPSGQVLIVGGYDPSTGIIADAELYDPTAQVFVDLGNTNTPRFHHSATLLLNGQVLIAGGETDPTPSGAYNNAELFNPQTWVFSPVSASMVSGREGHSATLLNDGTVLIAGGDLPAAGSLNTAEIYNPSAGTFTAVSATMTSARIFQGAVLLNGGKVLLLGGASDAGGASTPLNTAEVYDPTAQTFTSVSGNMTSVREHQTATLLNDGTVLETGGTDGTNILNTAELYTTSKLAGLASISISPASPSVPFGSQQLLVATGTFNGGTTQVLSSVLWSSSSSSVLTVSGDPSNSGYVNTVGQGTATVTASAAGVSGFTTVTVPAPALVSITITPQAVAMPLGTTQQFDAVAIYSDGSARDISSTAAWTSSSASATVSGTGLATAAALGTSAIQASSGSQSSTAAITVTAPTLVALAISPTTGTLAIGQSQQYQVVGTYTDGSTQNLTTAATWYAVPQASVSVTAAGLVTATGPGNANITASYGGFAAVSMLTVGPATLVSIAVSPGTVNLPVNASQQFIAIGNYADGSSQEITSSVTWSSSNGAASSVSPTGLATAVGRGTATITASSGSVTGSANLTVSTAAITLNTSRYEHSATLLNNGSVLIAGGVNCPSAGSCTYLNSAELYSPSLQSVANTGSMATARTAPAVLLGNGKVLIAGGYSCDSSGNCVSLSSAEIYDPDAGTFGSAGNMTIDRYGHTMTLLSNGQVLIAGGETCNSAGTCSALATAELYDPVAGTFTATGNLHNARFNASAVALGGGTVLIAGGSNGTNLLTSAEQYYPTSGTFSGTLPLHTARASATATFLNTAMPMIAGGTTCALPGCPTASTELYNGYFYYPTSPTGNMNVPRFDQTATLLTNGQVLLAGGYNLCSSSCVSDGTTELFDPVASTFTTSQPLSTGRSGHSATLLTNGSVFLAGGIDNGVTLSSTDIYEPASLAPPQLASVSISPSNPQMTVGATLTLTANGYDASNNQVGSGPLQAVFWSSSSPSVATVSNAAGSAGIVYTLSPGKTTITATVGSVTSSITVTVTTSLVSIAVTPSNSTVSIGSSQILSLTATGTYADGSTIDLSSQVNWASSNKSIANVVNALVVPVAPGSATITATLASLTGSATVTVNMPLAPVPPAIAGVSPASGAPGTQVTISGSGFGSTQGSGGVWLGTALASVVSWGDGQVVATVSTGSSSGLAQIQQTNGSSNSVPFTVNTATVTGISPTSGIPGTQVTISGSGFGSTQGSGNVWLGTAPGIVNSWSDAQVVATVAIGSGSGNALVLQNGVMSNAVPFTINLPHISGITPTSGSAGTVITISGNGFGSSQGGGNVWIGNTFGVVAGWSDSQIVASVASGALSGIVKVEQSGIWSNATTFTVPGTFSTGGGGGGSTSVTLVPNIINMLVGGTQSIEAMDPSGHSVTGLAWSSSNSAVVTLSADDPPIITAVGPGNATISAGNASADVNVAAGSVLPTGTVIWSNPGDGSGVSNIVPAVPSPTGMADVFALNADCNVQAITSDGTVGWTANIGTDPFSGACSSYAPDFQGGLVVYNSQSIFKVDGMTGVAYPGYTAAPNHNITSPLVHTDGTIFIIDSYSTSSQSGTIGNTTSSSATYSSLIALDPLSGQEKFNIQMATSSSDSSSVGLAEEPYCYDSPLPSLRARAALSAAGSPTPPSWGLIAGDGYLYTFDASSVSTGHSVLIPWVPPSEQNCYWQGAGTLRQNLNLLRVGTSGDSYETQLTSAAQSWTSDYSGTTYSGTTLNTGSLITNADQGSLATYEIDTCTSQCLNPGHSFTQAFYIATTVGPSIASNSQVAMVAEQTSSVQPVLQRDDGSYVGTVSSTVGNFMVAFTGAGSTLWTVPNDTPQLTTVGGGVVGTSGTTYDQNGNVTGQLGSLPTYSWKGAYQLGSADNVVPGLDIVVMAATYAATRGGNLTGNGFSLRHRTFGIIFCNNGPGGDGTCPVAAQKSPPQVTPMKFVYLPGVQIDGTNYQQACDFSAPSGCNKNTAHPEWTDAIKAGAYNAYKDAFAKLPAIVRNPATAIAQPLYGGSYNSFLLFDHIVYIDGDWYTYDQVPATGYTTRGDFSWVFYSIVLNKAESFLGSYSKNLLDWTPPLSDTAAMQKLMDTLGRGIGNTAAHETAHQISFTVPLPGMECGPGSPPPGKDCQGSNNNVYEAASANDAFYLPTPALQWEQVDQTALEKYFTCTAAECKP